MIRGTSRLRGGGARAYRRGNADTPISGTYHMPAPQSIPHIPYRLHVHPPLSNAEPGSQHTVLRTSGKQKGRVPKKPELSPVSLRPLASFESPVSPHPSPWSSHRPKRASRSTTACLGLHSRASSRRGSTSKNGWHWRTAYSRIRACVSGSRREVQCYGSGLFCRTD